MPVRVVKRGKKFRLIETDSGQIAKSKNKKPIDGGGHLTKDKAHRQARVINQNV